jgi:dihydrofolate synthase / folylpolyglutamate synthase
VLGLERTRAVYQRMFPDGVPFKVVTIAGTNGKGSCVAMLEQIYCDAGYQTGAYSSPHLIHYAERVQINGLPVAEKDLCEAFDCVETWRDKTPLTYFEFGTLAALYVFHQQKVDIAILEVGLGGRLDAVNIIDADVALVTSIGLDHTEWLGDNREVIGKEKAGIFRPQRPAICADPDPPASIAAVAKQVGATLYPFGQSFFWEHADNSWVWKTIDRQRSGLPYPGMRGRHQLNNAAAVLMVLELMADVLPVSQRSIRLGLMAARLPGRFQVVPGQPLQVFDVAHNVEAAKVLAESLEQQCIQGKTRAVVAIMKDKPLMEIFRCMADPVDVWYLSELGTERSASCSQLQQAMVDAGIELPRQACKSAIDAYQAALAEAHPEDRIVVFGSFYIVGDILKQLNERA